jgi:hypothetical protein
MSHEIERTAGAIQAVWRSGALSDEAKDALVIVQEQLGRGLGEGSTADELLLVVIVVDDSTSVALNMREIRFGHKLMLDALRTESFGAEVQVQTRALNCGVVASYKSVVTATPLTEQNYSGERLVPETPLYLQSLLTLGDVMIKSQEERARGVRVRTFTLIISDGADNKSGKITAEHVRALTTDMLDFASNHIIAGMGVGEQVDYRHVFSAMGIPPKWILTPGTSVTKLREVFKQIARSLALAATSETAFATQLVLGPGDAL